MPDGRRLMGNQAWLLFTMEIRQFFSHPRNLQFLPLVVPGFFLVLWPYISSPFIPVFIIIFAGLEGQFNNLLFRTPNEFDALIIFPVSWELVVLMKNVATISLTVILFLMVSMAMVYFSPEPPNPQQLGHALVYLSTVLFPLAHVGNLRSVQHPRRTAGWQVDDLAEAVVMLVVIGVLSIPYAIVIGLFDSVLLCIAYAAVTVLFWLRVSIDSTAQHIQKEKARICLSE